MWKLTLDNSFSLFLHAYATLEKCFCVMERENGAPFLIPRRASVAHCETAHRKNVLLLKRPNIRYVCTRSDKMGGSGNGSTRVWVETGQI